MTKKDYIAIAKVLSNSHHEAGRIAVTIIAIGMADMLANDNPKFNRQRFLDACGVGA